MIPGPNHRLVNDSKVHVALSSCLNGESLFDTTQDIALLLLLQMFG